VNSPALKWVRVVFLLVFGLTSPAQAATTAIFGGGPIYTGGTKIMDTLRASGFTTVIIWTIHVDAKTGDLILNDKKVASGGAYIGDPGWAAQLATLKQAPTSIDRIELGVGSWGVDDFKAVKDLMHAHGTGPDSVLYQNFKALKDVTGADAINYDDETCYDADSAVQFGKMLDDIGYKIALCPYMNANFWQTVQSRLGKKVDAIYLQCYAGGASNTPDGWGNVFRGLKPMPGLECRHGANCAEGESPAQIQAKMKAWKRSARITGGFMWLLDDMLHCSKEGSVADYAKAIQDGIEEPKPSAAEPDPNAPPELK
jgi:hypothetical protein